MVYEDYTVEELIELQERADKFFEFDEEELE